MGADDRVAAELGAGGADLPRAVAQMDPVEAEPGGQPEVVGDQQRHVAGMADRAQGVGGAHQRLLARGRPRQAHAGDGEAVEQRAQQVGKGREARVRRRDQVEPRGGKFAHASPRFSTERPA